MDSSSAKFANHLLNMVLDQLREKLVEKVLQKKEAFSKSVGLCEAAFLDKSDIGIEKLDEKSLKALSTMMSLTKELGYLYASKDALEVILSEVRHEGSKINQEEILSSVLVGDYDEMRKMFDGAHI